MLTPTQHVTLKAAILADPVLAGQTPNSDGDSFVAAALNLQASPAFNVWATGVPSQVVFDAITWANLTPADVPDTSQLWANRSLACQGKQFNLQTMLLGQATINGAKVNVRAGLQDALTGIPSGVNGAPKNGGWSAVQVALSRTATRAEKILADTSAGTGATAPTSAPLTFEGQLSYQDVEAARLS